MTIKSKFEWPGIGIGFIILFGLALIVACLFAFPYASVWDDPTLGNLGQTDQPGRDRDYNDVRNMLIAAVVGAFTLSGLYFTFRSAEASSKSALETKRAAETQAERQARAEVSQALGYKLITLYVQNNATSPFKDGQDWRKLSTSREARVSTREPSGSARWKSGLETSSSP